MTKKEIKLNLIFLVSLFGAAFLFIPLITVMYIPETQITVLNRQGQKVSGEPVVQSWQHYSFELPGNEEKRLSDENGSVIFLERKVKASVIAICLGLIFEKININPHASFGPHSYIFFSNHLKTNVIMDSNKVSATITINE